ncbi:hypothetical protein N752_29635 [Desulforamulus aquiferis]|nr:hypothetical protein [Desulforamulus aquiferis]RYD01466.1 hypothetical protein N752_29635 [Desulforamulus aquiferis]
MIASNIKCKGGVYILKIECDVCNSYRTLRLVEISCMEDLFETGLIYIVNNYPSVTCKVNCEVTHFNNRFKNRLDKLLVLSRKLALEKNCHCTIDFITGKVTFEELTENEKYYLRIMRNLF